MGLVFQDFVRNFFRIEQNKYRVKGESFPWPFDKDYGHSHVLMPTMNTDTSLLGEKHTVIIECKWTGETLQRDRLRSDHLYQLSAYMRYHKHAVESPTTVDGLLLYPLVDEPVDVAVRINEQRMRVRTIDLMVDWPSIKCQLLDLLKEHDPA